ncbi:unnamed protein product [Rotaria socialis]|uniref:Cyclic nucleotide-binding domain-containing protein n=1 Tax=Rotaria socialis TaxID=392032 RepID=A0A820F8R6_9BILA|nr:unnamed protein product [Rotaria socialis]CAF3308305.1 unnamed protein product [Rotaria socialis]CAF3326157.1 unnamed protein product [Rotaria socialis]CAF3437239.1 unnamed protein product [Rotaria socialis]CAF4257220.1 unnamed protein product [Rotaria socialis]
MTHIEIPSELPNILRNFTLSVLRTKPRDIIDHAVDYFTQLQRQQQQPSEPLVTGSNPVTAASSSSPSSTSQQSQRHQISNRNVISSSGIGSTVENNNSTNDKDKLMTSVDANNSKYISNEHTLSISTEGPTDNGDSSSEDEDEKQNSLDDLVNDEQMRRHYVKKNEFRRVSVAAERYNPEDDNDSDGEQPHAYQKSHEQRQRLKDAVCNSLLFRTLEAKQIDQVLNAMWEKTVRQDEVIIRQGDDGDNFYVIDNGNYDIYVSKEADFSHPSKVGEYIQTGSFGELALMYNQPRSATIIASTDGVLWVMGRQTFRKLVLKHAFRKRQMYEKFLRDLAILQSLTDYERSNVADALIPIEYNIDEIIIKQGDDGDRMFFIEDGECDIFMNGNFHKRINKGDYFGELALLNHEPRSATIIAASPKVKLASLEVESFERLLGPCMDLMQRNTFKYLK